MTFKNYIRSPFVVEAVEITEENMEEIAKLIGEVRVKDGKRYIALDRRLVPNVSRAYPGWFLTRLGDNFRCYAPKVFRDQFIDFEDVKTFAFEPVSQDEAPPLGIPRPEGDFTDV